MKRFLVFITSLVLALSACKQRLPLLEGVSDSYVLSERGDFMLQFQVLIAENAMPSVGDSIIEKSRVSLILTLSERNGKNIQQSFGILGASVIAEDKKYAFTDLENLDFGEDSPTLQANIRNFDKIVGVQSVTIEVLDIARNEKFHIKSDKINRVIAY